MSSLLVFFSFFSSFFHFSNFFIFLFFSFFHFFILRSSFGHLRQTQAVMQVIIAHSTCWTGEKEAGSHGHVCPSSFTLAPAALRRYLRSSPVEWALHNAHASSSLTSLRGTRSHIVESTTRVLRPARRVWPTRFTRGGIHDDVARVEVQHATAHLDRSHKSNLLL